VGYEHQADWIFAGFVDRQVVGAEVIAGGSERGDVLVLGLADGDAGDALDPVTGWRDECCDDARLCLQDLDDLFRRPSYVVGSVEVELKEAAVAEPALLDGLGTLAVGCAADADRLEVFLGDRVSIVVTGGERGAQPGDLCGELVGADRVDQVGERGGRRGGRGCGG